jgi:hypothetical protein
MQFNRWLGVLTVAALASMSAHASIIQVGNYGLGESGSVGAAPDYTPLVDSLNGHNITLFQAGDSTRGVITTGLAAPGSSAALQISQSALAWCGGWFHNAGYSLTDNWAIDLWIRPDGVKPTDGSLAFATHNGYALEVHYTAGTSKVFLHQGGNVGADYGSGAAYTLGQWQRISIIELNGTANFYVDSALKDSVALGGYLINPMLGFGVGGYWGANAAYDEFKVWSFDSGQTREAIETAMGIPEPSTLMLGLALGGLLRFFSRRQ